LCQLGTTQGVELQPACQKGDPGAMGERKRAEPFGSALIHFSGELNF
jgi:hypothetical protein